MIDDSRPPSLDLYPERRPGGPMESRPRPAAGTHWDEPPKQPEHGRVFRHARLDTLTPVFGTAQPPRALSGFLRRTAYAMPDSLVRHWMLLMLADRVDALEHRAKKPATWVALAAFTSGVWMLRRAVRETPLF